MLTLLRAQLWTELVTPMQTKALKRTGSGTATSSVAFSKSLDYFQQRENIIQCGKKGFLILMRTRSDSVRHSTFHFLQVLSKCRIINKKVQVGGSLTNRRQLVLCMPNSHKMKNTIEQQQSTFDSEQKRYLLKVRRRHYPVLFLEPL